MYAEEVYCLLFYIILSISGVFLTLISEHHQNQRGLSIAGRLFSKTEVAET